MDLAQIVRSRLISELREEGDEFFNRIREALDIPLIDEEIQPRGKRK